jgi:hypothetical protein
MHLPRRFGLLALALVTLAFECDPTVLHSAITAWHMSSFVN